MARKKKFVPDIPNRQKNLKRDASGNFINQYGVKFTPEEKKKMESLVTSVNRKRKKQLENISGLSRKAGGKDTGDIIKSKMILGDESEFILAKRSKSLQRIQSRSQFQKYMRNLNKAMSENYELERKRLYKRNYIEAMEKEFNDIDKEEYQDIINKIRRMNPDKFIELVNTDDSMEIRFVYGPEDSAGKMNQIRGALGMKLKEDAIEDI